MYLDDLFERIDLNKYIKDVSERRDLTWDIIQKYPVLYNYPKGISRVAPLDYIIDHPEQTWDFDIISSRKDLTIEFIKHFKNQLNQSEIAYNINLKDVIENPDLPWNYDALSWNTQISSNDLIEHPKLPWNYANLTTHIDPDFIYANPNLPWDYRYLTDKVNFDFIYQNPQLEWDHLLLGRNPYLSLNYVIENKNKHWHWFEVYSNQNITLEDIIKHNLHKYNTLAFQWAYPEYCIENDLVVDWHDISREVSLDLFDKYPEKPWIKEQFNYNSNIIMSNILEHPELPWDYSVLLKYNGITLQDILDHWYLPWDIQRIIKFKY